MTIPYRSWIGRFGNLTLFGLTLALLSLTLSFNPVRGEATTRYPLPIPHGTHQRYLQDKIVFSSDRDGNFEIYHMDLDGRNVSRLENKEPDLNPSVSPDGNELLITRQRDDGTWYVVNKDKQGERTILEDSGIYTFSGQAWSPDGREITYGHKGGIYVSNPNGRNQKKLTKGNDAWPAWSPDGKKIVYIRLPENGGGIGRLFTINIGTDEVTQITDASDYTTPAWRGDREILVSKLQRATAGCISAVDIITGKIEPITRPYDNDGTPSDPHDCFHDFSPVPIGEQIAFSGWGKEGKYQLFKIERDGTGLRQLTDEGDNLAPTIALSKR